MNLDKLMQFKLSTLKHGELTFQCFSVSSLSELEKQFNEILSQDDNELIKYIYYSTLKKVNGEKVDDPKMIEYELTDKEKEKFVENTLKLNFSKNSVLSENETFIELLKKNIRDLKDKRLQQIKQMQEQLSFTLPNYNQITSESLSVITSLSDDLFKLKPQVIPEISYIENPRAARDRMMMEYLKDLSDKISKQNELVSYANKLSMDNMNHSIENQEQTNKESKKQSSIAVIFALISNIIAIIAIALPIVLNSIDKKEQGMIDNNIVKMIETYNYGQSEQISLLKEIVEKLNSKKVDVSDK